jgi:hypothetical protein
MSVKGFGFLSSLRLAVTAALRVRNTSTFVCVFPGGGGSAHTVIFVRSLGDSGGDDAGACTSTEWCCAVRASCWPNTIWAPLPTAVIIYVAQKCTCVSPTFRATRTVHHTVVLSTVGFGRHRTCVRRLRAHGIWSWRVRVYWPRDRVGMNSQWNDAEACRVPIGDHLLQMVRS